MIPDRFYFVAVAVAVAVGRLRTDFVGRLVVLFFAEDFFGVGFAPDLALAFQPSFVTVLFAAFFATFFPVFLVARRPFGWIRMVRSMPMTCTA